MILKNNTETADPRLDRVKQFDPQSRKFGIRELLTPKEEKKPRSRLHTCDQTLDQGREGACVGAGVTHELISKPQPIKGLDMQFAREKIYWEAQRLDPWDGGSYPNAVPIYEGTSVLCGIKVARDLGYFDSFYWAFGIKELILAAGYAGPVVLGLEWMDGMFDTGADGFIHATGGVAGGHCILCRGVNVTKNYFTLRNSWGEDWGRGGDCYISFDDMEKLLHDDGEACVPILRHFAPRLPKK